MTELLNWIELKWFVCVGARFFVESVLNIHGKDWCWSWSSNNLATWCEELTNCKRAWFWERLKAGGEVGWRGCSGYDQLGGILHPMDVNLSKLRETVKDRDGWCTAFRGVAKSPTRLSHWMTTKSWILLNMKRPAAQLFMVLLQKLPQGGSTSSGHTAFFLPAISLLFSIGT